MGNHQTAERRLTVAHIMPWAGIGGVEIATLRMAELTRDHVRNVAFCLPDASALKSAFEKLGIETETYIPPEPSFRHFSHYYKASQQVARQIRKHKADIVHFSDEKAAYHNSLASLLASTKRICHLRVSFPTLAFRSKMCLLPIQSFIFVSQEAMKTFAVKLPERKRRVLYDAVEIPTIDVAEYSRSVRAEFKILAECTIVGMLARVSPQKDYFTLASAAATILKRFPDTRFMVVGDNSLVELNKRHFAEVSERLNQLGIIDKFIFTGHREDVPRLLAAMDICVLSTHREGLPLSILESMAMGKPVVATDVGGISELIRPGVTGYLHQHEDSQGLANAISTLLE